MENKRYIEIGIHDEIKFIFIHDDAECGGITSNQCRKIKRFIYEVPLYGRANGQKGNYFRHVYACKQFDDRNVHNAKVSSIRIIGKEQIITFRFVGFIIGEIKTETELALEGIGYRLRTRFARFYNLPELMLMFNEVTNIKTADILNLPRPIAHNETIVAKPSDIQKEMVEDLSKRAADVHNGSVPKDEDNMLKICNDGRKIDLV